MKFALTFFVTFLSFSAFSQLTVYDYEKIADPYYPCSVYIRASSLSPVKMISIEHKFGTNNYTKEQTKEWIDGLENLLKVKAGKTDTGKREALLTLSDGSIVFLISKDAKIVFSTYAVDVVTTDSLQKLLESLKKAYEKA